MKKIILPLSFTLLAVCNLTAQSFQLVEDINPGAPSGAPQELIDFGQFLVFKATDQNGDMAIYRSDGTESGTYPITNSYSEGLEETHLLRSGNMVYFTMSTTDGVSLWSTNPAVGGAEIMVKDGIGIDPDAEMMDNNGVVFFSQHREDGNGNPINQIWKSDGTELGTEVLKEWMDDSEIQFGIVHNGLLFFVVRNPNHGLWISDGTVAGTIFLDGATKITDPVVVNNKVYYIGGGTICKSNGTAAGTGSTNMTLYSTSRMIFFNDYFYYSEGEFGQGIGVELYRCGTLPNSVPELVKDISPGVGSSYPNDYVLTSDGFYFYANDGTHGIELWKSDGTEGGTHLVKDIYPGTAFNGYFYDKTIMYNNRLFFAANDNVNGTELWSTDGSEANTYLHQNINDAGATGSACLDEMTVVNNQVLFFAGCNNGFGNELWSSGTVGLSELDTKNEVLIVPNPATEFIALKSDLPVLSYEIVDLNGRIVASGNSTENIFIEAMESGSYLIQAVLSNGSITTQRLIKQ